MKKDAFPFLFPVLSFFFLTSLQAQKVNTQPAELDGDYAIQGEYTGTVGESKLGVQVIALGKGDFRINGFKGGLPGEGAETRDPQEVLQAKKAEDGSVRLIGKDYDGRIADGGIQVTSKDGKAIGRLKRVVRESPTLGAEPPKDAIVLFDGSSAEAFKPGKMDADMLLCQGANSVQRFRDHTLHIEFRLPYQPTKRGQGRGNSGCYLQARYEVQMLDSFGLAGEHNECGGIYKLHKPDVNMCFPPMTWQTYDVDFTAARFDADGKKTAPARMTVRHNGVVIHDNVELKNRTTASPLAEGPEPGFLHLQNHGNPVRYRNIWVVDNTTDVKK